MKRPAIFFDRDNTLIASDGYLGDPEAVVMIPGAADAVAKVREMGFAVIVFSNQSGVARGLFSEDDVHRVNARLDELLRDQNAGAVVDRHEFCPHHPDAAVPRYRQASEFRKPAPGMIYQAARQLELDLGRSWVVGDARRDIEAGRAAGCRTILFKDPALPPSSAATATPTVEPDFIVASLAEAAETVAQDLTEPVVEAVAEAAPEPAAEVAGEPAAEPTPELVGESVSEPATSVVHEGEAKVPESTHDPVAAAADAVPTPAAAELFPEHVTGEPSRVESAALHGVGSEPLIETDALPIAAREWHEGSGPERPGVEEILGDPGGVDAGVAVKRATKTPSELFTEPSVEVPAKSAGESASEPAVDAESESLVPLTAEADAPVEEATAEATVVTPPEAIAHESSPVSKVAEDETSAEAPDLTGARAVVVEPVPEALAEVVVGTNVESPIETTMTSSSKADPQTAEPSEGVLAAPVTEAAPVPEEIEEVVEPAGETSFESQRRRSPPAVILAAKAAREAALHSSPDASPEALRDVARQAAREAAMGLTSDPHSPSGEPGAAATEATPASNAPRESDEVAAAAEPAAPDDPTAAVASESESAAESIAWEPRPEPETASPPRPAAPVIRLRESESEDAPGTSGARQRRLEELAEQILQELKARNEAAADFSVTKLLAGITMVMSLAVLACAYLYKGDQPTLQSFLLLGLMLQALTISLLIMGRQR